MVPALAMWVSLAATAPVLVSAEGAPLVAPAPPRAPVVGASFDVGVPDGAALTVVLFPRSWLQLGLGALTHLGGVGFRLSVAFSPLSGPVRPLLALDYGHYFPGDFRWALGAGAPDAAKSALLGLQYDFLNAQLGLELGGGRFSFAIRGGISYLAGKLGAFSQGQLAATPPRISVAMPSARLGLTWFFA